MLFIFMLVSAHLRTIVTLLGPLSYSSVLPCSLDRISLSKDAGVNVFFVGVKMPLIFPTVSAPLGAKDTLLGIFADVVICLQE